MRSRSLVSLIVICTLAAGGAPPCARASAQDKIGEQQAKIHATHEKLQEKKAQLRQVQGRVVNLKDQLVATNRTIAVVAASLDVLSAKVRGGKKRLWWNQIQLDAAQATLRRHNDALGRRLVDAYERGELGYVNVLLAATSFSDFVERWDDIRYLIKANEATIRERKSAARDVSRARAALLSEEFALERAKADEEQKRRQLAALAAERANLLGAAQAEKNQVAQVVGQLEDVSAQEEAALEELIRQKQREEEERRRAAAEAARRAALLSGQAAAPQGAPGAPGALSWPASGPITSPFGVREAPIGGGFRMHEGIDIGAGMGTTIGAAADGRVIFAGWYGGYGNAVIVDHGGSLSTLYGHCSQVFVGVGQDVQRGQAIGAVGSTGNSTGPHLHFEVRIDGKPQDPMGYLR